MKRNGRRYVSLNKAITVFNWVLVVYLLVGFFYSPMMDAVKGLLPVF